jgi:signal transduction histidine kinase
VAHDLANPVAAISMVVDRLLSAAPNPDRRHRLLPRLKGVRRQAQEMQRLIEDLLDMSMLKSGRIEVTPSSIDAASLLEETRRLLEPLATARSLSIELDTPEAPVQVLADGTRMRQVLSNLVGNAIKFTPAGGVITVGLDASDTEVKLYVRDPGPGIPEEEISMLFNQYRNAEKRTGRAGLGLAIAKEITEAHGGRIDVETSVGEGSTFSVTLPAAR